MAYRPVWSSLKLEGLRIVRSGLAKGESIVVNGPQRVRPGSQVQPESVPMADAETLRDPRSPAPRDQRGDETAGGRAHAGPAPEQLSIVRQPP